MKPVISTFAILATVSVAHAGPPSVVADIAPVHSLVATVMNGVGAPDLLVPTSASPHSLALKPSQMRGLQNADLVIWLGPEMTPWLERALTSARADDQIILLDLPDTERLPFRDAAIFEHDHDHDGEDHDDHEDHDEAGHEDHDEAEHDGHDNHDEHDEADHDEHDEADHDDHDEDESHAHEHEEHAEGHNDDDHEDGHGHEDDHDEDHAGIDPHAWLDPDNAAYWMTLIADRLAEMDPDHAEQYRANAKAGAAKLAHLSTQIEGQLASAKTTGMIALHDAFQYFEHRFDLSLVGAISNSDAADPGPARIAALRDAVADGHVRCAFTEPQFNPGLLKAVSEDGELSVAVLDPLGSHLELGPDLYTGVLQDMATTIADCAN